MFSDSFTENPEVLLMLVVVYSFMALLYYFLHRRGKMRNQFDERYRQITNRFKAKTFDNVGHVHYCLVNCHDV